MLTGMSDLAVNDCFRVLLSLSYKRCIEEQVKMVACPRFEPAGERGGRFADLANNTLFRDLNSLFG